MRTLERKIISAYVSHILKIPDARMSNDDWRQIAENAGIGRKYGWVSAKRTMKVKENMDLANDKLIQYYIDAGLGEESVGELYREAIRIAKEKEDSKALIQIADRLAQIHQLNRERVNKNLNINATMYPNGSEIGSLITGKRMDSLPPPPEVDPIIEATQRKIKEIDERKKDAVK